MIRKQLRNIILLSTSAIFGLAGCASTVSGDRVLPQGGATMQQLYQQQYGSSAGTMDNVRSQVAKVSTSTVKPSKRISQLLPQPMVAIDRPHRLPNPLIRIYVYPHFDGSDENYIPGHLAYTQLYKTNHFALPGEPTDMQG